MLLPLPAKREADHVTHERMAQRRAVATRRCRDLDRGTPRRLEQRRRPRRKAQRVATEAPGSCLGRDDGPRGRKQLTPGGIEVVVVMVVREQDRIDPAYVAGSTAGPASFFEPVPQPNA